MAENGNDLFSDDALDSQMSFLDESKKSVGADGLYRPDVKKAKDKDRGYRAILRFLPNFTQNPELVKAYLGDRWSEDAKAAVGPSALEKVTHYVDIKQMRELCGYYDSPKNIDPKTGKPFGDKCPLSDTYWHLKGSNNAILQERANMLNYSKKYFSYVLVIEDEQQPELEGKVMIYQYGKTIKDKIAAERSGDITGTPCNVFNLEHGKDFVLVVKEVDTGTGVYPDYKMSQFRPQTSTVKISTDNGELKNVPLDDNGKMPDKFRSKVQEFLLNRDIELESFGPQTLSDEQQGKVTQIISYLTGKTSASKEQSPSEDDFTIDDVGSSEGSTTKEEDTVDDFDWDDFE